MATLAERFEEVVRSGVVPLYDPGSKTLYKICTTGESEKQGMEIWVSDNAGYLVSFNQASSPQFSSIGFGVRIGVDLINAITQACEWMDRHGKKEGGGSGNDST